MAVAHRETLNAATDEYVVEMIKPIRTASNGSVQMQVIMGKDVKDANDALFTMWLNEGETAPKRKDTIVAFVEKSKVVMDNGREFINDDIRSWTFA